MALMSVGELRDYLKKMSDWIDGLISSSPKVTVSNLPALDVDGGLKVHLQNGTFSSEKVIRKTLIGNVVSIFTFPSAYNSFEIMNIGDFDIYIDFGIDPAIDGQDSILIPANMGMSLRITSNEIRVISDGSPKVQIIGLK